MTSMTSNEIRGTALKLLSDIAPEMDPGQLKPDIAFRDQLDLDSMDFLDIVMELRKRYKLQIPAEEYPELATLNSCVNYLEPKLKES